MPPYTTNLEHLHHELHRLDLLLEQAVQQFRAARTQDKTADFRAVGSAIDLLLVPRSVIQTQID